MARPKKLPDEVMERAVRVALERERPIAHVAHDFGMHPETLRMKVRQAEAAYDNARGLRRLLQDRADRRPCLAHRNQLALAVAEYLGWFNSARVHQALDDIPPAGLEARSPPRDETITPTMITLETT